MSHWNWLFLGVVLLAEGIFMYPLMAAPTVKNLGGAINSNTQASMNRVSVAKLSTAGNRSPSGRALSLSNKSASVTTGVSGASKTIGTTDSVRLSGMHNNIIKSIGTKLSANHTSSQSDNPNKYDLSQRVTNLEEDMATKQEILEPGDGIDIKGNTISVSEGILALPGQMDGLAQEIDDLNDKFDAAGLSGEYYTIAETEAYLEQNYYTQQEIDQMVSQLVNMNIVNHFDPGFLHQGQP
jgi:hypothetical protein